MRVRALSATILLLLTAEVRPAHALDDATLRRHLDLVVISRQGLDRATAARTVLLGRLQQYQEVIRTTRAMAAGPARDYKLRRLLAEAQELSTQLTGLDARTRKLQADLEQQRAVLERLIGQVTPAQATLIRRVLSAVAPAPARPAGVLRVPRVAIGSLDGPREIEEKADLLKDSEEKLRRQIAEVEAVMSRLEARRQLRHIADRVDRDDGLFVEDSARQRLTRVRPGTAGGGRTSGTAGEADANYGALDSGSTPAPAAGGTAGSGTYAVVLREVLSAATLEALRSAGRSSDPAVRLQALAKVREELRRKAAEIQQREREYRERARVLREREQRR
jgi:phage shock protein A